MRGLNCVFDGEKPPNIGVFERGFAFVHLPTSIRATDVMFVAANTAGTCPPLLLNRLSWGQWLDFPDQKARDGVST